MKKLMLAVAFACTPAPERRTVDPQALRGVTLGLPPPADARPSPGIGCGQVSQDLALRAHKMLIASFTDAGASASNDSTGKWVLTVVLREATMGPENVLPRRTDKPVEITQPDAPPIDQPQQSWFNSGQGNVVVTLDATLSHDGAVVWRDTVSGQARSAPCVEAIDKVREALQDAVDSLRARVIPLLRTR
jgi:hypothetical protein